MNWDQVVEKVTPYVVRIDTPTGYGTGFICLYNDDRTWCGIATACHVVSDIDEWQQPIRIRYHDLTELVFLKESDRVIFLDWRADSAVIFFPNVGLKLPEHLIPLFPANKLIKIGAEIGWLGFPNIEAATLCFFSGNVSAQKTSPNEYLIDGAAVQGVSGGPVLCSTGVEGVQIIGLVSAYRPGRTATGSVPGLLYARDVSHFHDVISQVKSYDEAKHKKAQFQQ
ncbi:MAG: S1 family peptidase, partial [Blastocatellia bacterium]